MTKIKTLSIFVFITHALYAEDIAVPEPEEMLSSADVVAVATISKEEGAWSLVIKDVLKGKYRPNDKVTLSSPYSREAFSFDYLARLVGDDDFLFVGKQSTTDSTLQPVYGLCSFWPQGTVKYLLPERTLTDVINRAKKSLGFAAQSPPVPGNHIASPSQLEPDLDFKARPAQNPTTSVQLPVSKEAPNAKSASTHSAEPASSTPWSIIGVMIVAALGLLWLLLKGRR